MELQISARARRSDVRFEKRGDTRLMIASAVIMREMVFRPKDPGIPIYAPLDAIRSSVASWDGIPVLLGHHDDPRGKAANIVGFTEKPRMTSDGRGLAVDVVVNADRFPDAVDVITGGVDVSIGASAGLRHEPGEFDGKPYEALVVSMRPDHLAVLAGERGACSREDGCGIPLAACGDGACTCGGHVLAVLDRSRHPTYSGTSTRPWTRPGLSDFLGAYSRRTGRNVSGSDVSSLPADVRKWIASHTLLGDPGADHFRDLSMFPVVEPDTGKLNRNALLAVISGRGAQAGLDNSARDSAKSVARTLLEEEFGMESRDKRPQAQGTESNGDGLAARIAEALRGVLGAGDEHTAPDNKKDEGMRDESAADDGADVGVNAKSAEEAKAEHVEHDAGDTLEEIAAAVRQLSEKIEANERALNAALEAARKQDEARRRDLEAKVQAALGLDDDAVGKIDSDVLATIAAQLDETGLGALGALRASSDDKVEKDPYLEAVERIEAAFFNEPGDVDDDRSAAAVTKH